MRMAIQMDSSVRRFIPSALPEVKQNKRLACRLQFVVMLNANKLPVFEQLVSVLDNHLVVIAEDQMDAAIQSPEETSEGSQLHEGKVAQVIDFIIGLDQLVPSLDHRFVHLLYGREWATRI